MLRQLLTPPSQPAAAADGISQPSVLGIILFTLGSLGLLALNSFITIREATEARPGGMAYLLGAVVGGALTLPLILVVLAAFWPKHRNSYALLKVFFFSSLLVALINVFQMIDAGAQAGY